MNNDDVFHDFSIYKVIRRDNYILFTVECYVTSLGGFPSWHIKAMHVQLEVLNIIISIKGYVLLKTFYDVAI